MCLPSDFLWAEDFMHNSGTCRWNAGLRLKLRRANRGSLSSGAYSRATRWLASSVAVASMQATLLRMERIGHVPLCFNLKTFLWNVNTFRAWNDSVNTANDDGPEFWGLT
jgi:hypothetical protein